VGGHDLFWGRRKDLIFVESLATSNPLEDMGFLGGVRERFLVSMQRRIVIARLGLEKV